MMALAGVEPETLVSEPDALTTRPPPCAFAHFFATNCTVTLKQRCIAAHKYLAYFELSNSLE